MLQQKKDNIIEKEPVFPWQKEKKLIPEEKKQHIPISELFPSVFSVELD